MASCDANIVVASMDVELGVDLCTAKLVEEVCDEGDWLPILPGDFFEIPEVHMEFQLPFFFLANRMRAPAGNWDY